MLEFLDYYIDPPRYTIDECLERGLTYSVPLKAKLKLYCTDPDHEDFATVIQDVYLGQIPYMTEKGTFVINGAETCGCVTAPPFPRRILRAEHSCQRHQALFGAYNSFPWFMD